jgi:uncharacterized membrane protein
MPIRRPSWPSRALAVLPCLLALVAAAPARADLKLCNRMSYVVEGALGIEQGTAVATRGWFRVDPGACRDVIQGDLQFDHLYVHARALPVYGASPLPQSGNADLCVTAGNFVIAGARACRAGQRLARFTEVKPSEAEGGGAAIYLSEEAEYSDEQARDAGIQRLLTIAGYDASPVDGVRGDKTDAALVLFLHDNKLPPTSAGRSDFFDALLEAAQKPGGGFSWCNETADTVMAAIGIEENGAVTSRGWYRLEPGKCLRPDVRGTPQHLFSFGEAVDGNGRPLTRGDAPVRWGGDTLLCTRESKFELTEQKDCVANGLLATGFAAVDLAARGGATVRFKAP